MKKITALAFCLFLISTGVQANTNYSKAFELYSSLAEQGDATSQVSLGLMYDNGQGVTQNYAKAAEWYQKAANQGNKIGQRNLGLSYKNGEGGSTKLCKSI